MKLKSTNEFQAAAIFFVLGSNMVTKSELNKTHTPIPANTLYIHYYTTLNNRLRVYDRHVNAGHGNSVDIDKNSVDVVSYR